MRENKKPKSSDPNRFVTLFRTNEEKSCIMHNKIDNILLFHVPFPISLYKNFCGGILFPLQFLRVHLH